jgi:hypothetical protein
VFFWDATPGFLAERSTASLPALNERLRHDPADTVARRRRAEVLARQGDWDGSAAEFTELARLAGADSGVYAAGWWVVPGPTDRPPAFPPANGEPPATWVAPADDPNGFVSLPRSASVAVCRLFVARPISVTLRINLGQGAGLWVNGQPLKPAAPNRVDLAAGWNVLALAPGDGPRELFVRWLSDK